MITYIGYTVMQYFSILFRHMEPSSVLPPSPLLPPVNEDEKLREMIYSIYNYVHQRERYSIHTVPKII